jgi:hypothetical protein
MPPAVVQEPGSSRQGCLPPCIQKHYPGACNRKMNNSVSVLHVDCKGQLAAAVMLAGQKGMLHSPAA